MANPYLYMSICQPFLLSSLFSSSVIIKAIYGVFILMWGVWGACRTMSFSLCCTRVDRSRRLYIGVQGIMVFRACPPVNVSTRTNLSSWFDRSLW